MANIIMSRTNTYHLCSEGTRTDLLFHNQAEFIGGMNIVAIAAMKSSVRILAFCLMGNHFHFILSTEKEEEVIQFAISISQLYKRRMTTLYSTEEPIHWGISRIDTDTYLKYAVAYVIKNPTSAYYRKLSVYYPWASSNLYFCDEMETKVRLSSFTTIKDLGNTRVREMMKSRHNFPEHWYVTSFGFIWPGNYVDILTVENLYNDPREFLYYLSATKREHVEDTSSQLRRICIPDQELRYHAQELCFQIYHHKILTNLSLSERLTLKKQLSLKFGCADKQLSRILHLNTV